MLEHLRNFCADEAGAALPEYAILLGLVLALSVGILTGMGPASSLSLIKCPLRWLALLRVLVEPLLLGDSVDRVCT